MMDDESELRSRLAALETRNAQLEERESERNTFLRTFLSAVSHDLRAPLRVLDGFSRILAEDHGPKLDDDGRKLLSSISAGSQRLDGMISGVIRVGRALTRDITLSKVPMQAVMHDAVKVVQAEYPDRNVAIETGALPDCRGDVAVVGELLVEVLRNAFKFTRTRATPFIKIEGAIDEQNRACYTIADNGVGFNEKYASRLFEVFQHLHPQSEFEGLGVGLALAGQLAKRMDGTLAIAAQPDQGARVTLILPQG